jgi:hypothetical protein
VAREDHKHAFPAGAAPSALTVSSTQVTGTSTAPALADHVHAMPGSGTPGASAVGDTAAAGTATTVALSDHRHSREAFGTPVNIDASLTSLSAGSLTTVARADHVHTVSKVPVLIASTTVSTAVASVAFTSIPQTYTHLWLFSRGRSSYVGVNDYIVALFNGDTLWGSSNYVVGGATSSYVNVGPTHGTTNVYAAQPSIHNTYIYGYSSSYYKCVQTTSSYMNNTTGYPTAGGYGQGATGEWYLSGTAITSISLVTTGGANFVSGTTFRLYGIP